MFFINGNGNELINSDYVERFCIVPKPDAVLIVASYGSERMPVTLARYPNEKTAQSALLNLCQELSGRFIEISQNSREENEYRPRNGHNGAKRKSHGGS